MSKILTKILLFHFRPSVEGSILIKVASSRTLDNPVYYVITGQKLIHKKLNQARDRSQFEIKLNVIPEMLPSTKLIVYWIHQSGEIIYDSVALEFERELRNHVSLATKKVCNKGCAKKGVCKTRGIK